MMKLKKHEFEKREKKNQAILSETPKPRLISQIQNP